MDGGELGGGSCGMPSRTAVAARAVAATSASMEAMAALFCIPNSELGLKMKPDMMRAAAVA